MKQLLKWSSGGGAKRICQNKYGGFDGLRAFAAIGIAMMHYLANIDEGISGTQVKKREEFLRMIEDAKKGKIVEIIRFATECLSGIPSIVYGLFGGIFFVVTLKMQYSIIAGALTVAIIILPVIIRTTEEALKTVPNEYREGSLAMGATKFQTLYKVILPSALPGILSGVILSIGRVIGESAAVFLTAGTVASMPSTIFDSARTLTVHSYLLTKELGDISGAASVGIVLIIIVLFLNTIAKFIAKKLNKGNI